MRTVQNLLITGGCGFLGSNFLQWLAGEMMLPRVIINVDRLSYAAHAATRRRLQTLFPRDGYHFRRLDITNVQALTRVLQRRCIDTILHLAAETHVDRSLQWPLQFARSNCLGTAALLEATRNAWQGKRGCLLVHVSTDEVFGSLDEGRANSTTPYRPGSPYAASKAGADHLVRSYARSFGLPAVVANLSNCYGPLQHAEKLIPQMIWRLEQGLDLPLYGNGDNRRDWLHARDAARALWAICERSQSGDTCLVGTGRETSNLELVRLLCTLYATKTGCDPESCLERIRFVADRPGHDRRYALECGPARQALNWEPEYTLEQGLAQTLDWYLEQREWMHHTRSRDFRRWQDTNYGQRTPRQSATRLPQAP